MTLILVNNNNNISSIYLFSLFHMHGNLILNKRFETKKIKIIKNKF